MRSQGIFHERALKIAGRTVGNILERKYESNVYGMLPAGGQIVSQVNIYRRRTCNVVSNVHYWRNTYQEDEAVFRETHL